MCSLIAPINIIWKHISDKIKLSLSQINLIQLTSSLVQLDVKEKKTALYSTCALALNDNITLIIQLLNQKKMASRFTVHQKKGWGIFLNFFFTIHRRTFKTGLGLDISPKKYELIFNLISKSLKSSNKVSGTKNKQLDEPVIN